MNYYQAHKNKKPKKLHKRKPNYMAIKTAKAALISAMGAFEIQRLQTSPIPRLAVIKSAAIGVPDRVFNEQSIKQAKIEKELAIFNSITNTAAAIIKALSPDYLDNFKRTGKYGRKPK